MVLGEGGRPPVLCQLPAPHQQVGQEELSHLGHHHRHRRQHLADVLVCLDDLLDLKISSLVTTILLKILIHLSRRDLSTW